MPNINAIIACIDLELRRTGQDYLTPVEAGMLLDKRGLLDDNQKKPGQPLRRLLRQGKIPHAYQLGGAYSRWVIPNSRK